MTGMKEQCNWISVLTGFYALYFCSPNSRPKSYSRLKLIQRWSFMKIRGGGRLWGYIGYIIVDPGFEEANIVVVMKLSSWKSVPQSNRSWKEAVQIKFLSY